MFDFFNQSSRAFAKRAQALLQEARFAQLEHEAAAEHHHALAKMYADRVRRLEGPLQEGAVRLDVQPGAEPQSAALEGQRTPLRVLTQTGNQAVAG